LLKESQKELRRTGQDGLPFAGCLVTDAGPRLGVQKIIHMCVPSYLPVQDADAITTTTRISDQKQSLNLLRICYNNVLETILEIGSQRQQQKEPTSFWTSILNYSHTHSFLSKQQTQVPKSIAACLPAMGCGYNAYPIDKAANIALDCMYQVDPTDYSNVNIKVTIEIRIKETRTFDIWRQELLKRVPIQFRTITTSNK